MSKMKTLAMDIDGVLADWHKMAAWYAEYAYGIPEGYVMDAFRASGIGKPFSDKNVYKVLCEIARIPEIYGLLTEVYKSRECMLKLAEKYNIFYVTTRGQNSRCIEYTGRWLIEHQYPRPYNVIYVSDKVKFLTENHYDVIVDDRLDFVKPLVAHNLPIVWYVPSYMKPRDEDCDPLPECPRTDWWPTLVDLINAKAEN